MQIHLHHALALCALTLSLGLAPVVAQQTGNLQQRMGAEQFRAAGLQKLSAQELASLEHWMATQKPPKARLAGPDNGATFSAHEREREPIYTYIVGPFDGWSRGREFTMTNGQSWRVVDADSRACRPTIKAQVQIKPSVLGSWLMYVPGCYANVHVKRLR